MNTPIKEFEQIYSGDGNFIFDHSRNRIKWRGGYEGMRQKIILSLIPGGFFFGMFLLATWWENDRIPADTVWFGLASAIFVIMVCAAGGRDKFAIDMDAKTLTVNKSTIRFGDCREVRLASVRQYLIVHLHYRVTLVTKQGLRNFSINENDETTARKLAEWLERYVVRPGNETE